MDFIDEQDIPFLQIGQDRGEIAGMTQDQPGGRSNGRSHLSRDDVGDGRLARAPVGHKKWHDPSASPRRLAASMQISKASFMRDWPTYSRKLCGRSAASMPRSSSVNWLVTVRSDMRQSGGSTSNAISVPVLA